MTKEYKIVVLHRGKEVTTMISAQSKQELYNTIFGQYPKSKILKISEHKKSRLSSISLSDISDHIADFLQINHIDEESKIFF